MSDTTAERRHPWWFNLPGVKPLPLLALATFSLLVAVWLPASPMRIGLVGAGAGLAASAVMIWGFRLLNALRQLTWIGTIARMVASDPWPSVLTDSSGRITHLNALSEATFGAEVGAPLHAALARDLVTAEPLVARMLAGSSDPDRAMLETVQVDRFDLAISAQRLASDVVLWRLKQTALDPATIDGDLSLPVVSGSARTGWRARNAAARAIMKNAGGQGDTPVLDGFTPSRLAQFGDIETLIYLPETRRADVNRNVPPVFDLSTLDALIDGLPVPILRITTDGVLDAANASARRLLGLSAGELPPLYQIVEGMGRSVTDWLADAVACRGLLKPEFVRASLPKKDVYLQIVLGRIENEGGTHLIGILNDATELKTLEAQFVQSQKMQAIGQLAGGIAHDFNNLLTAISGHCDLLLLRHDQGDPDYSDLKQIGHNANRAASLVGQLLAFSRKQTLKAQPMDLHETMSDLTHLLNRLVGEKVRLTLNVAQLDKVIRADPRQFEQVIMNLVVNARDAMPDGGPIEISVDDIYLDAEMERDRAVVAAGDYIIVRVRDSGHGIEEEKLPKIFEPFFTTKKTGEGTGLGLSTAYGIVKQTGGFIFAESEVGKGTCFTLMFPAHSREALAEVPEAPVKPSTGAVRHHGVVLLVEDEAPVRAFASRALRLRGYTVLEAEDAETALETLKDTALQIDVFVTDVIMPGLDGPTWVRQALEDRPDTRVVFVSGYSQENLAESQARVPNSVFLAKPFSLTELTDVVQMQMA